jgi:8-oxo-dGTP pyrophosphatase MutT (NUDIX family)
VIDPAELPGWLRPLAEAVPGLRAEDLSRFPPPDDGSGRASAVLIAMTELSHGPGVLLIERAADMRTHAGQVAFPGGAVDEADPHRVATALREAEEEVGLDPAGVRVVAELPAIFIPPSGFVVTPVLAWWPQARLLQPIDPAEVARVAVVAIAALVDPANRFRVAHPSGWIAPGFEVDGLFVWGFTAALLDRLLSLGGWSRPWDESRIRSLPEGRAGGARPGLPSGGAGTV